MTNPWGKVFIRRADVARGRVYGSDGEEKLGGRTLAYFVAHEVTHAMVFARFGWWHARRLAAFQREGYPDYVAFARTHELASEREALRRNEPDMVPHRSGLYRRYELLVAYLLEPRHMRVEELLAHRLEPESVEYQLVQDAGL
jgi:hypothetical protein